MQARSIYMPFLFHFWGLNCSGKCVTLDIKAWKWKFWCFWSMSLCRSCLPALHFTVSYWKHNVINRRGTHPAVQSGSRNSDYKQYLLFDAFDFLGDAQRGKKNVQEINKQIKHNKNIYLLFNPWSTLWKWRLEEQHFPAMQVWLGMTRDGLVL